MAIDPGIAATGYAIGGNNQVIETGIIRTYPKDGSDFERCKKITEKIEKLIKKHQVKEIYIEDYRVYGNQVNFHGRSHGEKTIQVITHLQLLCEKHEIHWELVNHNKWKADFKRVWELIVYSRKFPHLTETLNRLQSKKQDHETDAFMILLPKIFTMQGVLYGVNAQIHNQGG